MRKIYLLVIGISIFFIWAILFNVKFVKVLDLKIMDLFYNLRGRIYKKVDVVVVGVDEYSLSALEVEGDTWPWKREVYGKLLEKVFEDGAKVAAFDISFTEAGEEDSDSYFASTLLIYGNVILGTYLINEKTTYLSYDNRLREMIEKNTSYLDYAYKMTNFREFGLLNPFTIYKIRPVYEPFAVSAYSASYEIGALDADGIVRKIPLLVIEEWARETGISSGVLPHMNVLTAAVYMGINPQNLLIDFAKRKIIIGNKNISFDNSGYMHIWFYGKGSDVFPEVPFYKVLNGEFKKGTFKDKIVLIGYTATAKGLYDLRVTPFSNNEAGVFVHANAIQNLISEEYIKPISPFYNSIIFICIMIIVGMLISLKSQFVTSVLLMMPIIILITSFFLFLQRIYIVTFHPFFGTLTVAVVKTLSDFLRESAEKRRMKEYLYRYVPDKVAEEILNKGELKLGGETRNVVVLFSDIKGFTSMSEKLTPEEVVSFLNVYLTKMSEIIRYKYEGTIDKFIGDAIMAIFGAPVSYENDIDRSLKCALEMRSALKELNKETGLNLDSGIGIHYGPAIVGNIGAPFRMDYTCIGDTVNTASRIEHLTREVDAEIIVSEDVMKRTDNFTFEYIGSFSVKGKSNELRLYKLIGEKVKDNLSE
ncbi:MAG: adenylate/guanylate cyclase domain-containing protein [Fervidobacterium sp.]|nr:adenylate/guanylate cyclase domain-containing protein [Fervidobacterium sp.]